MVSQNWVDFDTGYYEF